MLGKLTGWEDTIIALATPPGIGAIGVIRLSGPASFSMVNVLFPSKDLEKQESHTLHVGSIREAGALLDEAVVSLFRGPKSYTGEDVVEISCHGSPYVQQRVIEALLRQGGRLARAGEFTQRAFLNGKLDLAQAEAVADLIASNTEASAKAALHTIRGGFSNDLFELREQLMSFSALIELELDFSQEDVEFADRTKFYQLITDAERITSSLLASFRLGNVIRNGVQVAIVGKPNAGKSTLLNTLLNENRAIVSEIAGTTRDTIEETLNIDGILFRLIDTAGIREHTTDTIEQMGVGKSLEKMEVADVVLYVFDVGDEVGEVMRKREELTSFGVGAGGGLGAGAAFGGRGAGGENAEAGDAGEGCAAGAGVSGEAARSGESEGDGEDGAAGEGAEAPGGTADKVGEDDGSPGAGKPAGNGKRFLWVGNKVDAMVDGLGDEAVSDVSGTGVAPDGSLRDRAAVAAEDAARRKFAAIPDAIFISAKRQQHIDVLKQRLVDQVLMGSATTEGTIVTNARHYHALQQVGISLAAIRLGLDAGLPGDLLALDIRHCLHYLGEITGEITSEDRLGYIFGKFCIGK